MTTPPADDAITGPPVLLDHWRSWEGAIDCAFSERVWTAAELRAETAAMAERLAALGFREGEPVVLMLANTAAFPVALAALLELGCNPLLTYAGTPAPALARVTRLFAVRRVLHDFIPETSALDPAALPEIARIDIGPIAVSVLEASPEVTANPVPIPGRGVVLHPTSGTYGAAKYCVRNQFAAVAEARNYAGTIRIYDRVRMTATTPLTHAFAFGFGLMAALLTHSTLALDIAFNPKRILRQEADTPSTILAIVPPMARALCDLSRGVARPPMARAVFYAGSAIDPRLAAEFEATFAVPLFTILGTTETGAISTSFDDGRKLPGVGRPLRNVTATIEHSERYGDFGTATGELAVRSTSMMQGYLPGIASPFAPIAIHPTGDIAALDGDGNLRVVGRIRDIINLGGMKVDPADVEAVLMEHPAVRDAAVYPGLRPNGAEFVQAAVVSDSDPETLRRHCLLELDAHKVPSVIHLVAKLPRTPSGKCLKVQCPGYPMELLGRRVAG